jgi:hypothetical protein
MMKVINSCCKNQNTYSSLRYLNLILMYCSLFYVLFSQSITNSARNVYCMCTEILTLTSTESCAHFTLLHAPFDSQSVHIAILSTCFKCYFVYL